ncbi:hypothetical protein QBC36DRAFT_237753 [Triangularia setosa]|uniref:BHLH domain-containing protein n=1 Tax=Triangularia setosa TaxID=2587417 RepID=A0AAN6W8J1_9PEZI|nr:hypothetical protein QBC36DRAFT_237753 [Podospora setosa]
MVRTSFRCHGLDQCYGYVLHRTVIPSNFLFQSQNMNNPGYYGGHYDDEDSQNLPYSIPFSVQEQDHANASVLYPNSTSPLGASILISPTDPFNTTGTYGDYVPQSVTSLVPETSYYAPSEPVSAYDTASLSMSSGPRSFSYGQIRDEPEEVMNQGLPLTIWDSRLQSFTPYQENPHAMASLAMDENSNIPHPHPASSKQLKGLTIDTMTMAPTNPHNDSSRPHRSARRSKSKRPSAPTTSLSSPTSQSTISSLGSGSGSAAPNSLPEDYDSEQDQPPVMSSSSTSKYSHNARTRHNMVEQKYRHRLNTHFDKLLEVLPSGTTAAVGGMGDSYSTYQSYSQHGGALLGEGPSLERERKVSKAEVLDRARLYIQTLENEHVRLQQEREELRGLWEGYYERAASMPGKGPGLNGGGNGAQ